MSPDVDAPRIAIVAHRDPRGDVGARVALIAEQLRGMVDRVVLVADGLSDAGRQRAEAIADRVVVAPGPTAIALLAAGLTAVDAEMRDAGAALVTDTERYPIGDHRDPGRAQDPSGSRPDAWVLVPTAPRQPLEPSPWLWASRAVLDDAAWAQWWRSARDDRGALGMHDLVGALEAAGRSVAALAETGERSVRASLESPGTAGFVERVLLTADPLELEEQALDSRSAARSLRGSAWQGILPEDLRLAAPPRQVHTAVGGMAIPVGVGRLSGPVRLGVLSHVFYPDALAEIGSALRGMPTGWDWIVTTGSEASKADIERRLETEAPRLQGLERIEVRVVASNRGRDISAFLLGCADLLRPDAGGRFAYDVVLKLHSKRSPQDPIARAERFQRHALGSITGSLDGMLQLFLDEPELGMAMPPQIHVGYPTLGRAWFGNRPAAERMASRLSIDVPFDEGSPLAPYGSMFAARPAALAPLVDRLGWRDFPDESGYRDGGAAHVVERLFAYAAIGEGFAVRTVTTPELAAESHQVLEWKLQEILRDVPGTSRQQVLLAAVATRAAAFASGAAVRAARIAGRAPGRLARSARRTLRRRG
ncbi:rhamnan synthesis F family protein [Agrococcus terreus]|uniref:Rhamnan synthesis protein F n=1 Tax=Agrococcus terreus TaxID=574649 RepID=A0ABQ2KGF8_9MICO|nr:rhamnan synthesis F family protein [Agrococcus terreus]GGN80316.1 hypothetical protein GCM10010968_08040 [Agrococcus terreus]